MMKDNFFRIVQGVLFFLGSPPPWMYGDIDYILWDEWGKDNLSNPLVCLQSRSS
ncbi:hypothetical protein DSUL_100131 [Desulfovibrionales bacterium]